MRSIGTVLGAQALEIREVLESLKRKVSDLETKQKTILGEPLPEESK